MFKEFIYFLKFLYEKNECWKNIQSPKNNFTIYIWQGCIYLTFHLQNIEMVISVV